ncbi:helix-turn-helix transcriptional regulator [uncultured Phascolarctobacterium sp.]|uniref:helix-turn-helix domain-containing protein n=1 Tax=uncultured Phascolarctobacterium sp. TaxID=512296 RepID=UPI0025F38BD9|nr:helix-turn-helix transcriptional regulator [uncultured Phascolarctobacterium sp.]
MEVKDIIKQKRLERGYTMKELADIVGVSEATVSRWEAGILPTLKSTKINALSCALGIAPMSLISSLANSIHTYTLSAKEEELIKKYRQLNADGQNIVDETLDFQLYKLRQNKK